MGWEDDLHMDNKHRVKRCVPMDNSGQMRSTSQPIEEQNSGQRK